MIETTDIAALREICEILNEYGYDPDWEGGGVHVDNAAKTVRMIIMQHCESSTMLEPERQLTNESGERFYKAVQYVAKLESEIAALKAKLANPVVLPAGYSARAGHPFHEGERNVMIPNKHGDWLSRFEVEHAIHVAGFPFTVKGD